MNSAAVWIPKQTYGGYHYQWKVTDSIYWLLYMTQCECRNLLFSFSVVSISWDFASNSRFCYPILLNYPWKCHAIIVIKTDLSRFVVTMHEGLWEQYIKSLGWPQDLASCMHTPSCIVTTNPSRTGLNPLNSGVLPIPLINYLPHFYLTYWVHISSSYQHSGSISYLIFIWFYWAAIPSSY